MKKALSFRIEEDVHRDLKLLAAMKEKTLGDVIDDLVRDEMRRLERLGRKFAVKAGGEVMKESSEVVADEVSKVVEESTQSRHSRKKKRGR